MSPSSRRAWIEINSQRDSKQDTKVALLAEGVDRNFPLDTLRLCPRRVALLAEGVDRNSDAKEGPLSTLSRPPRGGRG